MADLDAELLALAGDSSGDEGAVSPPRRQSSSSPVYGKEDSQPPASRRAATRNVKKGRKRRDYSDDEDDDRSVSGASESVSMSHSESEAEFETEEKPMYPYDKLYYNAEDKAKIEAKPEIEREAILAERANEIEKFEQNAQLRRMLQARAKEEAKQHAKKRKASTADLDETAQRKSSRQRTKVGGGKAGEANSVIAAYKKQREEKALRDEQRRSGKLETRGKETSRDDFSDRDADAESDHSFEYDSRRRRKPSPPTPKDDPVVELSDIQRVRIGRENFAQVCYTPGFENTLTNCYARVCLGPGRMSGQNEYRLCSIKGFQEGKPYAMEGPNKKQILVNKYIIAAHGKATKPWSFLECSNSRFTEDEWRRYRATMANEDIRMPTRGQINSKLEQINKLISHRFTDVEISIKIKQQNEIMDTVNRTAERKAIKEKIYDAEERGDEDVVKDLEDQLLNLVPLKLALGTNLNVTAAPQRSTHEADRLAELNRRNTKQTTENIQKAAMLKRRQYKKMQAQAQEAASGVSGNGTDKDKLAVPGAGSSQAKSLDDDLFGSASDISRAGTPVNGSRAGTPGRSALGNGANIVRSGTPLSQRGGEKKGLPVIKKSKRDDEVLAGMDLGIDIDI